MRAVRIKQTTNGTVSYRNCTRCGAPLIAETVERTEALHERGMCLPVCKSITEARSESGRRGGSKRAQFLKEHTPMRHGEAPTRLPISKDAKMDARIEAIVAADLERTGGADRDVVLMDKKFRIRGGRRLG